jgi:hypothetical protein
MKVIASRQMPIVNTHQVVWQPVTDNGDRSMRLAPIDWQPSGAHACIQMLVDDLRNAEAKLTKALETLREFAKQKRISEMDVDEYDQADIEGAYCQFIFKARDVLDELEGKE